MQVSLALPHFAQLKDGSEVLIRKAGPEDSRMLYLMFKSLSVESASRRFLMPNPRLETADMQKMLEYYPKIEETE